VIFHLAEAGYDVDGIDFSPEMLARGLKRAAHRSDLRDHAFFIEGDAATFAYSKQYAVILIPYNGLMHFHSTAAQIKLIQHLNRFLLPDGVMIFDLPNAGEIFSTGDDSSIMLERTFYEPDHGNFVMQQSVSQLDRTEQMQYITWIYDEIDGNGALKRTVAPLTLRYVFPSELDLLLQVSGMKRVSRFGYYDESPFEEGCERMLVIARKA
jgi:SAM-dependent methyltransferase